MTPLRMLMQKLHHYRLALYLLTKAIRNYKERITLPNAHVHPHALLPRRYIFTPVLSKWIPLIGLIYAASPPTQAKDSSKQVPKQLLDEADELFNDNHYEDTYKLLKEYKSTNDVEALWRLTRALYNQSKEEIDSKMKKSLIVEAYHIIKRALSLNDTHFAVHKWYAVLLDAYASYAGIKARINELPSVKSHMLRASELNPKDATTLYMLGTWCYSIADMPWYQRKIASTLFASPPHSSYEEALTYFLKAEETQPNFYSLNLLMIGKTYLKLNNKEKAAYYLTLTTAYAARTDEDLQAKKDAAEILKNIK